MATGWNVMDALNNKTKAAAEDNKTKARFRTKDIAIKQMYSNDKNFYSIPDIEQLAQDILAVGLLENLDGSPRSMRSWRIPYHSRRTKMESVDTPGRERL